MLKKTLAFMLLGLLLSGVAAAYAGGLQPGHGEHGHHSERDHDRGDD